MTTKVQVIGTTAVQFDPASSTDNYLGIAPIGSATSAAVWQIRKITVLNGAVSIQWADGNHLFDNVWDDRTSITYS